MVWCILILVIAVVVYVLVMLSKSSNSDRTFYRWQLVDETTERWAKYLEGMRLITSEARLALELRKTVDGKRFYVWTAEEGDYWDLPDEVYSHGKVDCDGFARLTTDALKRFVHLAEVWWMEYYGYYRVYEHNPETGEYEYKIKAGGHAITAYKVGDLLLAFSNTKWWFDKNFQDFLDVGEETFPEGLYRVVCRHWLTGKAQWIQQAKDGEILEATNVFNRKISKLKDIRHLDKWSVI